MPKVGQKVTREQTVVITADLVRRARAADPKGRSKVAPFIREFLGEHLPVLPKQVRGQPQPVVTAVRRTEMEWEVRRDPPNNPDAPRTFSISDAWVRALREEAAKGNVVYLKFMSQDNRVLLRSPWDESEWFSRPGRDGEPFWLYRHGYGLER